MPVVSFDYIEQREKMAEEITRLRAEVKTRTLDYLGQVGQLSEEIERLRAALRETAEGEVSDHPSELRDFCRTALDERT